MKRSTPRSSTPRLPGGPVAALAAPLPDLTALFEEASEHEVDLEASLARVAHADGQVLEVHEHRDERLVGHDLRPLTIQRSGERATPQQAACPRRPRAVAP